MRRQPLVNFADVLRAADAVGVLHRPEAWGDILDVLGYERRRAPLAGAAAATVPREQIEAPRPPRADLGGPVRPAPPRAELGAAAGEADDAWPTPLPPAAPDPETASEFDRELDRVAALGSADEPRAAPRMDSLLRPVWQRAVLTNMVGDWVADGPIDTDRTAELLAKGEVVRSLPRTSVLRANRGVDVLLDVSDRMRPYAEDQFNLADDVARMLPPGSVRRLAYRCSPAGGAWPLAGVPGGRYALPTDGRTVLVLGDVGAGGGGRTLADDWVRFAGAVRRAGSPLVALTPFDPGRVPPRVRRAVCVLPWERTTTSGLVRLLRRHGRPVTGAAPTSASARPAGGRG